MECIAGSLLCVCSYPLTLEQVSTRLNRLGFPNQAGSDSSCLPAKEAGGHGDIHFDRSS